MTIPHHHTVGIGAGPSNLSLAALGEDIVPGGVALFERSDKPAWHPGLLQSGTQLQTSWIKDLVSLVDPRNRLSFLNYLVTTGRVHAFLNAQYDAIPRLEYATYFNWASEQLGTIRYGVDVSEIGFDGMFTVSTKDGVIATADHLVLGLGTRARVPDCFQRPDLDGIVIAEQLDSYLVTAKSSPYDQIIVVGGGQTGAESVLNLIGRGFRDIRWIGRGHWFAPLDDSPPANDFYRPSYLRFFHGLPVGIRQRYLHEQKVTSDGVSMSTLQDLYRANYEAFLREGRSPVMMLPGREVVEAVPGDGAVTLWCERDWGGRERHTARYVVLATGREPSPLPLSPSITELLDTGEDGEPIVEQDYSIRWKHAPENRIFVQNRGRLSHGVADPNLSLLSVRSALILNSLLEREAFAVRDEQVWTLWG